MHDDLIFNIPTGQTINKAMNIENYKSGIISVLEILPSEQIVSIVDEVATLAVTIYLKAKYVDQIINRKFRDLSMW